MLISGTVSVVCLWLPVWLSDNTVSINVVTLRQAWLVPSWVTVFGRLNHLGTEPDTQIYSARAILLWVGETSTQRKLGMV